MNKLTRNQLHQMASHLSAISFRWEIDDIIAQLPNDDPFKEKALALLKHPTHRYHPLFQIQFCEYWHDHLTKENIDYGEKARSTDTVSSSHKMFHWDRQSAILSQTEQTALLKIAQHLQSQSKLQWLAENLGKSTKSKQTKQNKIAVSSSKNQSTAEINGWQLNDDLSRLLPQEVILFADDDLEWLFYAKWAEKNLLTYDNSNENTLITPQATTSNRSEPPSPKGPWILAIDASGSMIGCNEQQTKAFAYALILEAISMDRPCHLLIFSTTTIEFTFSANGDWQELLHFLSYEFHGGTNFDVLLTQCFKQLENPIFKQADVLIVSDFIAPILSTEQHQTLKGFENNHRFFALNVSPYANTHLLNQFHHNENSLISNWFNFG